jgi:hypothetical protein
LRKADAVRRRFCLQSGALRRYADASSMPASRNRQPKSATAAPRPAGSRAFQLTCANVLLLHWPVDARALRACVPAELEIDTYDGTGWVTVTASSISGMRPIVAPPFPGLSAYLELDVRACVRNRGQAGLFFFSFDVSNPVFVWLGRSVFRLPYFRASMESFRRDDSVRFVSRRTHQGASRSDFECVWVAKAPLPRPRPGELAHFLTERYQLFAGKSGRVVTCRFWHEPWPLRQARLGTFRCDLSPCNGLVDAGLAPIAHHADELAVSTWRLRDLCADAGASILEPALSPPPVAFRR